MQYDIWLESLPENIRALFIELKECDGRKAASNQALGEAIDAKNKPAVRRLTRGGLAINEERAAISRRIREAAPPQE